MKLLLLLAYGFLAFVKDVQATDPLPESVVCLETRLNTGETLIGAGFFIAPGVIATVQHQVKDAHAILAYHHAQRPQPATLVLAGQGLALLHVADTTTPYLLLEQALPAPQTPVMTYGCQPRVPPTLTSQAGTVTDPKREQGGHGFIETQLPIQKGNSGGPLLLGNQRVAGIINGYDESNPQLSVSIPTATLVQLMAQQEAIAFAPEITHLWQKAQTSADKTEQLSLYSDILNKAPWHTEAHYNQGMLYFAQQDYPKAKAHFQLATQQRPDFYNAYIYLGITLSAQKDYSAARNSLIQAILINAENPLAYSLIAGIYQGGFADRYSERNALQRYIDLETTSSKANIAKQRLHALEQSFKP